MEPTTIRTIVVAVAFTVVGAALTLGVQNVDKLDPVPAATAQTGTVRHFEMDIVATDLDMGEGGVWHAWTYNGTVPGPTLTATVGDIIEVTVHNKHNITHSFHTHLSPYALESDGSQLNIITGIGGMAMIAPGASYTYSYVANEAGLFYYHCHSADGGKPISQHMAQGLYGAIIIKSREEAPIRDEVIFMSERGFDTDGDVPYYLMNGKAIPGGEHHLEEIFVDHGIDGVAAHFGKTIPLLTGKVGEPVRVNVVNIGDIVHTFHMHAMTAYDTSTGKPVPAQVLGLTPGEVGRFVVTPNQPGIWLFHCHVVNHADAGMIGVFVVEAASAA